MKKYVAYLNEKFNREKIEKNNELPKETMTMNKPRHSFWASPVNAEYGWKEWCENNNFRDTNAQIPVYLTVLKDCNIFAIESTKQLILPQTLNTVLFYDVGFSKLIDYNFLRNIGISAVELEDASIGHRFENQYEISFNSWDCESICFLDSKAIVEEHEPFFEESLKSKSNRFTSLSDYIDNLIEKKDIEKLNIIMQRLLLINKEIPSEELTNKIEKLSKIIGIEKTLLPALTMDNIAGLKLPLKPKKQENIVEYCNRLLLKNKFKEIQKIAKLIKKQSSLIAQKYHQNPDEKRIARYATKFKRELMKSISNNIFKDFKDIEIHKSNSYLSITTGDYYIEIDIKTKEYFISKNDNEISIEDLFLSDGKNSALINELINKMILDANISDYIFNENNALLTEIKKTIQEVKTEKNINK